MNYDRHGMIDIEVPETRQRRCTHM